MTFSGGSKPCLTRRCSVRTCTGEVCVRSRLPSLSQKVSWLSRAGWSPGMFSASKLKYSDSISGPSSQRKPMLVNRSTSSFWTIVIGCMAPMRGRGPGSVGSKSVAFSSRSSCALAKASLRSTRAFSTACLIPLATLPKAGRSSFGSEVTDRTICNTSPSWPKSVASRSAMAAASDAAAIACSHWSCLAVISMDLSDALYSTTALDLPAPLGRSRRSARAERVTRWRCEPGRRWPRRSSGRGWPSRSIPYG